MSEGIKAAETGEVKIRELSNKEFPSWDLECVRALENGDVTL